MLKEEKLNLTDHKIRSLFSLNPILEEEEKDLSQSKKPNGGIFF